MYGDFPAKNTVYTLYIPMNVWFWPTLQMWSIVKQKGSSLSVNNSSKLFLAKVVQVTGNPNHTEA